MVLSLGETPLADALLTKAQLAQEEGRYPLDVAFCNNCSLVQILEAVSPDVLFCRDYPYYSSFSDALLAHSRDNALRLIERQGLDGDSLVVELASNDGYMLRNFAERGIPVLGIDPAEGPAKVAMDAGIPTLCTFFGKELAASLRDEGKSADVIIANNVLAHVPDLNGFVEGIGILLKYDGVAVIEVPYVKNLVEHCEFDTIYHEHLCYYSVTALASLFRRHGLSLNHVEHYPIHGGSLRLFVGRWHHAKTSVGGYLTDETKQNVNDVAYYHGFASRVSGVKTTLVEMLRQLKGEGKRIAAYGAAAKGSTLLNYTGIDSSLIDFVVDRNVHKQGLYMPGVHIPIDDPARLLADMPDYVLLLAWNFRDEVLQQQDEYRRRGGKFIVPVPCPTLV
jgi:SAM-dependent methyltransferase